MFKLGLIVNPIAGMGGSVGLKGTDGAAALRQARARGAQPSSERRAAEALAVITDAAPHLTLLTPLGAMGERAGRQAGMDPLVIDMGDLDPASDSTPEHTRRAVVSMMRRRIDLLLFAGGDGTARDICDALTLAQDDDSPPIPVLGIPAGVKMHSGVFAVNPRRAGEIVLRFMRGELDTTCGEVMDIDEAAFRQGVVSAALHGYLRIPHAAQSVQSTKSGSVDSGDEALRSIAQQIVESMDDETLYIIGPGTTMKAITDALGLPKTLLGVDVVRGGRIVAADAAERELLRLTADTPAKIIVTAIGGQGCILGRGNQQLSPRLIRQVGQDNIIVAATPHKLRQLHGKPLLVDTGDPSLDAALSGYISVVTGYRQSHIFRVAH